MTLDSNTPPLLETIKDAKEDQPRREQKEQRRTAMNGDREDRTKNVPTSRPSIQTHDTDFLRKSFHPWHGKFSTQ